VGQVLHRLQSRKGMCPFRASFFSEFWKSYCPEVVQENVEIVYKKLRRCNWSSSFVTPKILITRETNS
jgi:hypothetical protein